MICVHGGESEMIVGMKENDIRLNTEPIQVGQSLLDVLKEFRIESIQVEFLGRCFEVRIYCGFDPIEFIPFGEESESHLREVALAQRFKGLGLQCLIAVKPVVESCA